MAQVPYTKRALVQRIRKHVSNSRQQPDDFAASDNEILLLIDQVGAAKMVGQAFLYAKIEGNLVVPDAYYTTYSLPALVQDSTTGYWYAPLPQPPNSLPLGYSIADAYFAETAFGKSDPILPIKAKRVSYRNYLPMPVGSRYWIQGSTMYLQASNNQPLLGLNVYVVMSSARTEDMDDVMNVPEDDINFIFDEVVKKLMQRYGMPQDVVVDDLPAGNKTS